MIHIHKPLQALGFCNGMYFLMQHAITASLNTCTDYGNVCAMYRQNCVHACTVYINNGCYK